MPLLVFDSVSLQIFIELPIMHQGHCYILGIQKGTRQTQLSASGEMVGTRVAVQGGALIIYKGFSGGALQGMGAVHGVKHSFFQTLSFLSLSPLHIFN